MKTKTLFLILFLLFSFCAAAQPFTPTPTQAAQVAMQSQQIMQNGQNHDGTIYAPFDNTVPSEQSSGPNKAPGKGGNPKTFIGGPDQTGPSPVGEPWVLAAFALLFAGVVWLRGKKARAKEAGTKK